MGRVGDEDCQKCFLLFFSFPVQQTPIGIGHRVTATTSFTAPTTTATLPTATATATPVMRATAMAEVGGEHLVQLRKILERAHHAGRVEHRRDGSQLHGVADSVRHLKNQQGHQEANSQWAGQDRDHGGASARQYHRLGFHDTRGARELPLYGQVVRLLPQM